MVRRYLSMLLWPLIPARPLKALVQNRGSQGGIRIWKEWGGNRRRATEHVVVVPTPKSNRMSQWDPVYYPPKTSGRKELVSALVAGDLSVRDQEFTSGFSKLNVFPVIPRTVLAWERTFSIFVCTQYRSNDGKQMMSIVFLTGKRGVQWMHSFWCCSSTFSEHNFKKMSRYCCFYYVCLFAFAFIFCFILFSEASAASCSDHCTNYRHSLRQNFTISIWTWNFRLINITDVW